MKGLTLIALMLLCPVPAGAQEANDPFTTARFRLGPIALTPTIGIRGLGIDTNVFNEVENPKRDFTVTLSPRGQFWLRLGRVRLGGTTQADYVHFHRYASERALNTRNQVRIELPLRWITPYVTDTFSHARERPGYEIDARARQLENQVTLGTDVRVGAKTTVGFAAWRTRIRFDADEVFLGTSLNETLNRVSDGIGLSVRRALTPLTTFAIETEARRDRFEFSPIRDADSVRVAIGFDFSPFTLITGSGRIGYRKYDTLHPDNRGYRGLTAAADLGYTLLGVTRFSVHTERDIAYSYDNVQPYYVQTGASVTVTQKITPRWDVQLTGGQYELDYRRVAAVGFGSGRIDRVRTVGGGVGYTLGTATRLGINLDNYRRASDSEARAYKGSRLGASVSYAF